MADSGAPLFAVARLQMELDRLFQEARGTLAGTLPPAGAWQPAVDVVEHEDRVVVLMELPEVSAAELTIEVQHGLVTVRGVRRAAEDTASGCFLRLERPHGSFARRIDLGPPVDTHRGRARLCAGLLVLEFPRVLERRARPRPVTIEEEP